MTLEKITPLSELIIEDMRIHGMDDKAQNANIGADTKHRNKRSTRRLLRWPHRVKKLTFQF